MRYRMACTWRLYSFYGKDRKAHTGNGKKRNRDQCNFYTRPVKIFEILSREQRQGIEDQRERAHFITLVYLCKVPEDYVIPLEKSKQGQVGALKWFADLPEDLIPIQECYRTNWDNIKKVIMED